MRLTGMLEGTLLCEHRREAGSTRVRFWTNRHLASHSSRLRCLRRVILQIVYARCAGLDVHKKTVVVCARLVSTDGTLTTHIRTFGTTTAELLKLVATGARAAGHPRGDGEYR